MKHPFALALMLLPVAALAQTIAPVVLAQAPTLDLTGIATAVIAGIFAVLGIVLPLLINARIKDSQAAATLGAAVKNSLGAMEQAATTSVVALKPVVTIPGVPASLAVPVQYILNHAGDEAARFGLTPAALAEKVDAQIGLAKIAAAPPMTVPTAITGPSIAAKISALTIPPPPAAA